MDQKKHGTWYENAGGVVQSNEWYTPPEVFKALDTTFDLDVATIKGGVSWIPAKNHFYKEIDGLNHMYGATPHTEKKLASGLKNLLNMVMV